MKTNFSSLDKQTQKDLITWLNFRNPDGADKRRLAALYNDGGFMAWDCPNCGDRVFLGEPKDWGNFQGVCQADYTSYPAVSSAAQAWRNYCRAYCQGNIALAESLPEAIFTTPESRGFQARVR